MCKCYRESAQQYMYYIPTVLLMHTFVCKFGYIQTTRCPFWFVSCSFTFCIEITAGRFDSEKADLDTD